MNDNEARRQEEEVLPAVQTEEGDFSDQSGNRIARDVSGNDLAKDGESVCKDQGETRDGRAEDPLDDQKDCGDDQKVLAVPDALGQDPGARDEEDPRAGILELREKLKDLEERLNAREAALLRLDRECGEFRELYPDVAFSSLSDKVWEDVQKGIPIAAAFALYERRCALTEELANKSNGENKKRAPGAVSGGEEEYFSPGEVRAMSQEEVRKNYDKIVYSMQKWN